MFNEYWKAKAAKRRKAWAAVAKRFANVHAQMEEIRKKVYLPLDYNNTFSFDGYKEDHLVEQNPIVKWDQMKCHFTENGLRDAMATEGADLANLTMLVSRESIVGVEAPCPLNRWEGFYLPNKVYDYEQVYHAWLKRVYAICTDVETVSLTDGDAPNPEVPPRLRTKLLWVIDNESSYMYRYDSLRKTGRVCLMEL